MANPTHSQEDYNAVRKGIARSIFNSENPKETKKEYNAKMNKEIFVSDIDLRNYVKDIFAEQYRSSSYNTLLSAKNNPKAIAAYFNFINAYNLHSKEEESYSNVCCMAVDWARNLLKNKRKK